MAYLIFVFDFGFSKIYGILLTMSSSSSSSAILLLSSSLPSSPSPQRRHRRRIQQQQPEHKQKQQIKTRRSRRGRYTTNSNVVTINNNLVIHLRATMMTKLLILMMISSLSSSSLFLNQQQQQQQQQWFVSSFPMQSLSSSFSLAVPSSSSSSSSSSALVASPFVLHLSSMRNMKKDEEVEMVKPETEVPPTTTTDSDNDADDMLIQEEITQVTQSMSERALKQVQFLASKGESLKWGTNNSKKYSYDINDGTESMLDAFKWRIQRARAGKKNDLLNELTTTEDLTSAITTTRNNKSNNKNNSDMNNNNGRKVVTSQTKRDEQVFAALSNLELDMQLLDNLAGQKTQLTAIELALLSLSVFASSSSPWILGGTLTEFLPPVAAAFSAAIGIGAEYVGRVAVADGKEVAAATIGCASEAEGLLANAERAKAITPVCVGVSASATTFSLLVPVILDNMNVVATNPVGLILSADFYLACPLVSVLSAAVCSLALQETKVFCDRATSIGNRRFAKSGLVGRSWKSTTEQVTQKTESYRTKWRSFIFNVVPAPIIGSLVPNTSLATKGVIVTALAAAQCAYILADCEFCLARATDAVAIKARSAAVCDTYANQGARSAAILPFTSALSGLCAAATAAIVELPFLETLSHTGTFLSLSSEMVIVSFFPIFSTLFAAAASVSKARCEVDAEAAVQAASTLALEYDDSFAGGDGNKDPRLRPFRGVSELIRLVCTSTFEQGQRAMRKLFFFPSLKRFLNRLRRTSSSGSNSNSPPPTVGLT